MIADAHLPDYISFALAAVLFVAQIFFRERFRKIAHFAKWGSALIFLGVFASWSVSQYLYWRANEFTKLFLPPYRPITYFLGYALSRFLGFWAAAFAVAILFQVAASYFNRKFGERFFEPEEIHLCATGILLAGYPGFFFYIPTVLLLGVILSIYYTLTGRGRAPLYYFWLPAALFVIIIKGLLISPSFLNLFNF